VVGDAAFLLRRTTQKGWAARFFFPDAARSCRTIRNRGLARVRDYSWRKTAEGTLAFITGSTAAEQILTRASKS